ncbi:DUF4282 domain-containing protein [Georgenia faecalis]|uniref:DUF4282 domain-containing protein n=1 Tax=Georgenia faecalis TaxID=2483799 RepID=UPI000FD7FA9F|nr:DUF4282 domain-containing protein [Georgenia faecalis]
MSQTPPGGDAGNTERWRGYGQPQGAPQPPSPYQPQPPAPGQVPPRGPGPAPWNTPGTGDGRGGSDKGFFGALFDFSFRHFVTPSFVKIIYAVAIVAIGLAWLVLVVGGFMRTPLLGVVFLVFGSIVALFYVLLVRVSLELTVATVQTAQNTAILAQRR